MGTLKSAAKPFEWRRERRIEEIDEAIHVARLQMLRGLAGGSALALFVAFPFVDCLAELNASPPVKHFRIALGAYVMLWPGLFLLLYFDLIRQRRSATKLFLPIGLPYRMNDRAVMHGSRHLISWTNVTAFRVMVRDGYWYAQLVHKRGLHQTLPMSAESEDRERLLTELRRYSREYEASRDGPIDDTTEVPRVLVASLAFVCAVAVTSAAAFAPRVERFLAHSHLDRQDRGSLMFLSVMGLPAAVCGGWYLVVRRDFNPLQRQRLSSYAAAAGLCFVVLLVPAVVYKDAVTTIKYLNTVPAATRESISRTIVPHSHD